MPTTNTAGAPWGASVAEWTHFAATLRLQADLLPVVSNPGGRISASSKMRDLGKTPSRYNAQREVVGIPSWTQHQASDRDIGRWSQDGDLGICLQTRVVRAIDIDIADPVAAQRVLDLLALGIGDLPRRMREGSGKCLLAFTMPGNFQKRVIRTPDGIIEFLATGQQFIAVGTHPSGARYQWVDADGVLELPAAMPVLTPAEFECAWQAMVDAFALPDGESRQRGGMLPAVPRSASDLMDPTVAWLDANGWVTGYERDGRVDVRCPWDGEHTSDSGPSSTSWFPAGVGGFAQGHFRCLHAHCAARTDGDFLEAVGYAASDFDVLPVVANATGAEVEPLPPFVRDRTGRIEAELNNVLMALRRPDLIGCTVGFDEFKGLLMMSNAGVWTPFTDTDYTKLRSVLATKGFKPIGPELIKDAVRYVGMEMKFDSAIQWAHTLRWDGVKRIDTFYSDYFGIAPSEYLQAVARYTWTALAGRCLEPGAKCDMVPVFIGLQAAGKTTVVEAMSPIDEAFVEINLERKDDDLARSLRGKLVGEIAELRGLQGREAESIKAWISRRWEEWTPKFREFNTRFARRLLLFGTGNEQGFLDDAQERRWLPMVVGSVNVEGVRAVRDQLWAEGVERFREHGVMWQDAYMLAPNEHGKFKVSDPWDELISNWLARDTMDNLAGPTRGDGVVRISDLLISALGFKADRIDRRAELRVGKSLRKLGFKKGVFSEHGVQFKGWHRDHPHGDLA